MAKKQRTDVKISAVLSPFGLINGDVCHHICLRGLYGREYLMKLMSFNTHTNEDLVVLLLGVVGGGPGGLTGVEE